MNKLIRFLMASFFLSFYAVSFADTAMPKNELSVAFDLDRNVLNGISRISLPSGQTATVNLSGLKILSASINEHTLIVEPGTTTMTFNPGTDQDVLTLKYEAEFKDMPESDNSKNPGVVRGNLLGKEGISLTDEWYPSIDGLSLFKLTTVLPQGFEAISEAEEILVSERADLSREFSFAFPYPLKGLSLIAGKYLIEKDKHNGTDIYTYFLPGDKELSGNYISYTKKYLDMYEKLIGKYPFKRFSIVENMLPTGYAMPTFTLLGKDIIRLPFIVETSLGHEILHQWFGNLVFTDNNSGNWSEGLTTYLADHMFEELKGSGWEHRKNALITFRSYVTSENDFPLASFAGRTDKVSGAIGYAKSAMVFHMLKNLSGEDDFYKALRAFIEKNRFRPASWEDIRTAFESATGKDMAWFFRQWIEEKGSPEIEIKNIVLSYRGSKAKVSFEVHQTGKNYKLHLPVLLRLREGEGRKTIEIEKQTNVIEIETDGVPVELVIDDNYDLFRSISEEESPAVISGLLGCNKRTLVIPQGKGEEYRQLSEILTGEGFSEKKEEDITYDDLRTSSLIIPGTDTSLVKRLFGKIEPRAEDFYLIAKRNPLSSIETIAIIGGSSPSEMNQYIRKIAHYGKYSLIAFKEGKNTVKTVNNTERGLRTEISEDVIGIEIPRLTRISDIIGKIQDKKIIYIGEGHDKFEHHRVQLEVIRALHKKNRNIAIAMEMFQKPFQQVLNDYINGEIEEKEFLKKSEYFKRWGFDYNLYREILLYAREYKIQVIALNIPRETVSKVSREGVQSLSKEELRDVPEYLDISDTEYLARLKGFFERHKTTDVKNFDFFYQAQVLWDESMAQNLNEYVRKNPDYQVVVIAGMGHMAFGSGIPKRAYRLNQKEYTIILNSDDIQENVADFVVMPSLVKPPESPRLMAILKEEDNRLRIADFPPESISEKAGLRKDDLILSLDDTKVEGLDDIKIFLFYKKKGDEITVKVSRQRFLFGPAEMEFKVVL